MSNRKEVIKISGIIFLYPFIQIVGPGIMNCDRSKTNLHVHELDYVIEDGIPVLRLFGRDALDRPAVALFSKFRPYFYCMPKPDSSPKKLRERIITPEMSRKAHVIDARVETKGWKGAETDLVRVILDSPRNVRESRSVLGRIPAVEDTYEKDILFKRRFIIDKGIEPLAEISVRGKGEPCEQFSDYIIRDAELEEVGKGDYLEISDLRVASFDIEVACNKAPDAEKDPIIMIGIGDSDGSRVLSWGSKYPGGECFESEGEMISRFVDIVRDRDYDVLVGYNSDSFDLPYLKKRALKNDVKLLLGRDDSEVRYRPGPITGRSIIRGRVNIDLYPAARRMLNLSRYTLDEVYHHFSGKKKRDLDVDQISSLWERGGSEGVASVAKYCKSDVEATMLIADEILPTQIELSKVTKLLLTDVSRMGQSQMVEWLLIRKAHERNLLVPNKPRSPEIAKRRRETYEGGYVLEPRKGLWNRIVALDFRSLYPTIIVTHNVDSSTMDCKCCEGENVSPTGHMFCKRKEGFIPSILAPLIERRGRLKEQISELHEEERTSRKKDAMQRALKILSNSFYGYTGYPYARWYSRECAESVTGWGRLYIKKTIDMAESNGFQVLYSDTDSVFITRESADESELKGRAEELLREVNSSLPGIIQLEYQGYYPRGFFVSKKRYALIDELDQIRSKGLEVVRRDWSPIAKETQQKVLEAILEKGDPSLAAEHVTQSIKDLYQRSVDIEDLTISTTMTKRIENYESDAPHVALAKRLMEKGRKVDKGATLDYVVRKGRGNVGDRAALAEDASIDDYDIEYYVEKQVLPPSMRILSTFGYREDDIRHYKTTQQTLDSFG